MAHVRAGLLRVARWLGWLLLGVLGLLVLAAVAFQVRAVREDLADRALGELAGVLPGALAVGDARWPAPGRIELDDVHWTADGDTLLTADALALGWAWGPLLSRDVVVEELTVAGLRADVPALSRTFAGPGTTQAEPPRDGGPFFPRAGSLPGVPSLAIESLRLDARRVRLDSTTVLTDAHVAGSATVLAGQAPALRLESLNAQVPARDWLLRSGALVVDLQAGTFDGTLAGRLGPDLPVHLSLQSTARDSFVVVLGHGPDRLPPDHVGLRLAGHLDRDGVHLEAMSLDGKVVLPAADELAALPGLAAVAGVAPGLPRITATVDGELRLQPDVAARITVRLAAERWLEDALVRADWGAGTLTVDTLSLDLPGLALTGAGRLDAGAVRGRADLRVRGTQWLTAIRPDGLTPESLSADLTFTARGARQGPALDVQMAGSASYAGFRVDSLALGATVAEGARRDIDARLLMVARDLRLAAGVTVLREDDGATTLRTTPLDLAPAGPDNPVSAAAVQAAQDAPRTGRVHLPATADALTLTDVQFAGAVGEVALDGEVVTGEGLPTGNVQLAARWPVPPPLLTAALADSAAEQLRTAWRRDAPYRLAMTADIEAGTAADTTSRRRLRASGEFRLPGPRDLIGLIPASAAADSFGPLAGTVSGRALLGGESPSWSVDLGLARTAWIDTAVVAAYAEGSRIVVDSLQVSLPGVDLRADGVRTADEWDGRARLAIHDTRFLAAMAPGVFAGAEAGAVLAATFAGTPTRPRVRAELTASWSDSTLQVPTLLGRAVWNADSLVASVRAPDPTRLGPVDLDSLTIRYEGVAGDTTAFLPATIAMSAHAPGWRLAPTVVVARVAAGDAWRIEGQELDATVGNAGLTLDHPFRLVVDPARQHASLDALALSGGLGSVTASGQLGPEQVVLDASVRLELPDQPLSPVIPSEVWPARFEADLAATATDSFTAAMRAIDVDLGGREHATAALNLSYEGTALAGDLHVVADDDSLATGTLRVPAELRLMPYAASTTAGDVAADLRLRGLPIPASLVARVLPAADPRPVVLDARALVAGPVAAPSVLVEAAATFPEWPELKAYALRLAAVSAPEAGLTPALRDSLEAAGAPRPDVPAQGAGMAATVALVHDGKRMLDGAVSYPLAWSLSPPGLRLDEDAPYHLRVDADRLRLDHLDALLPAGVNLEGDLALHLGSEGRGSNPDLSGSLRSDGFSVRLEDGTRVHAEADLELAGTGRSPRLAGSIELESGTIQIPEDDRTLLPTDGNSTLWRGHDRLVVRGHPDPSARTTDRDGGTDRPAPADTTTAPAPPDTTGDAPSSAPDDAQRPLDVELDVRIAIPSGLSIAGRGLNVELAGDLHLIQSGDTPVITGNLEAVQGRLRMLGRTFEVDQGQVTFYGDDTTNPTLSLTLSTTIDAKRFTVTITGTAQSPELALGSDPDMSEGDIMSYLVFGRPLADLESQQLGLVQQRSLDLAAAYGIQQLEGLSQDLGVDLLTIQQSRSDESAASLVVGKYLSSRALLKYEQSLAERSSFLLNLEYFLSRHLKLETLLGQQSPSGVEFTWTDDY